MELNGKCVLPISFCPKMEESCREKQFLLSDEQSPPILGLYFVMIRNSERERVSSIRVFRRKPTNFGVES